MRFSLRKVLGLATPPQAPAPTPEELRAREVEWREREAQQKYEADRERERLQAEAEARARERSAAEIKFACETIGFWDPRMRGRIALPPPVPARNLRGDVRGSFLERLRDSFAALRRG